MYQNFGVRMVWAELFTFHEQKKKKVKQNIGKKIRQFPYHSKIQSQVIKCLPKTFKRVKSKTGTYVRATLN